MKIEHFALNVSEPVAMAEWYCANFGMSVKRKQDQAPFTHFLADSSGSVMIEIYNNPSDAVPAYAQMDPLLFHLAFVSSDPGVDKKRLMNAGATLSGMDEIRLDDGSHIIMLRDPWGLAIQLCKRGKPMI
jgi:catechol-2,3-dioxygenase